MKINYAVVELFKDVPIGTEFTTKEAKEFVTERSDINPGSFQPSDMAYNSTNKAIEGNTDLNERIFLKVKRGLYKYVGPNYKGE